MMTHKRASNLLAVLAMGICMFTQGARAQAQAADTPAGAATVLATESATVEAVDAIKRAVTLKMSDGATATMHLGKEAVNFDQIQVGDVVHATVLDRMVVYVGKPGEPSVKDGLMIARAPKGAKPGVIIAETTTVNAKIKEVDPKHRTVTLDGIEGNERTFKVAPNVDMSNVKDGDELVVRFTRGMALMVDKPAEAQQAAGKIKPGNAEGAIEALTATATVESVDAVNRLVTLKSTDGQKRTIHLGKEAVNFDQIRVGDTVRATLVEAAAVAITKPGAPPSEDLGMIVARRPKGEKPGVLIVDTDELTATLEAIDAANHKVTLVGTDGKSRTLNVGPKVDLAGLKIGDDVVVKYTEALAIVVEPR
jgi:hypothetical protein